MVAGKIDFIGDGMALGWFYRQGPHTQPILFVDEEPATLVSYPTPRPDVCKALNISVETGFAFRINRVKSDSVVRLCALVGSKFVVVDQRKSGIGFATDRSSFSALLAARRISPMPEAIAITCWEGSHNPIGRAKVLYEIAAQRHPTVLFAYLFDEYGGTLWPPLRNSDMQMVLIPWRERHVFHQMLAFLEIRFDTIWMCKPRLPTFILSSMLSHAQTSLILDLDDNEEQFASASANKSTIDGFASIGLARALTERIKSRTVASISLQRDFGGFIVRHASSQGTAKAGSGVRRVLGRFIRPRRVGFVGTVHPHKNIVAAARAAQTYSLERNQKIEFHVYGDFIPTSLIEELTAAGAIVKDITIPNEELSATLASFDVVLTGFPPQNAEQIGITQYQITSKIGDALTVGRPVLVPKGPSVDDLAAVPGLFLFDEENFSQKLQEALRYRGEIGLPKEFTLAGAYQAFAAARDLARKAEPAWPLLSSLNEDIQLPRRLPEVAARRPTLLLIWKHLDAGIYGRRIDQLARSYRRAFPDHDVIVLQVCHEEAFIGYAGRTTDFFSDASLIVNSIAQCSLGDGAFDDGVRYDVLRYATPKELNGLLTNYVMKRRIVPENTIVILFPIIPHFDPIADLFCNFRVVVDVVDNEFGWGTEENRTQLAVQYCRLMEMARTVVFNSEENRTFFADELAVPAVRRKRLAIIENWYTPPTDNAASPIQLPTTPDAFNVIYSGNLSDRVDYQLMSAVADSVASIRLHLFGTADRDRSALAELISRHNVIYYGARPERTVLAILQDMDLAIMPHVADKISRFMNPLKVYMYKAAGVPCIATDVPGVRRDDAGIKFAASPAEFVAAVLAEAKKWQAERQSGKRKERVAPQIESPPQPARDYIELISELRSSET